MLERSAITVVFGMASDGFFWPVSHFLVPDLFINECWEVPSDFYMYLILYLLRYLWVQALYKFQSTLVLR
jgi:hypothetical protein